eukprot:SAG31_NODE_83_length_27039_cov_14.035746_23_plen_302_part_00
MPYDYDSIMHYPCKPPKCQTLDPNMQSRVGQREKLSAGDIAQINDMYQCKAPGYTQVGKWGDCRPPGHVLEMDPEYRVNGRVKCNLPSEAACQAECDTLATCSGYAYVGVNHCGGRGSGDSTKACAGCPGQCFLYGPGLAQGLPPWKPNDKILRNGKVLSSKKWEGIATAFPEIVPTPIGEWSEGWSEWVCKRKNTMGSPNSANTPYPCMDEPGHGCRTRAESECVNEAVAYRCKSLCSAQQPVGTCGPDCVTIHDDGSYTVAKCANPPAAQTPIWAYKIEEDEVDEEDEGGEEDEVNNSE